MYWHSPCHLGLVFTISKLLVTFTYLLASKGSRALASLVRCYQVALVLAHFPTLEQTTHPTITPNITATYS
jgi:hypothetical protein